MTLLPIVGRELRVRARKASTYWFRVSAATTAVLLVLLMNLTMGDNTSSAAMGSAIFNVLAWAALFLCLLAGMINTCDCVSQERREGTLGLLFLTDLKGFDIVFGKLAVTSLNAVFALIAIFPLLAIPLLLGGLGVDELIRVLLTLGNAMFLSLAIGMAVSTISVKERRALTATVLAVLFFTIGLPLIVWAIAEFSDAGFAEEAAQLVLLPSPGYTLVLATVDSLANPARLRDFKISLGVIHGIAWFLILFSCWRLPRSWKDKPASAGGLRLRERWKQWSFGTGEQRRAFQTRLMEINSFFWVAARDRIKPMIVWGVFGLLGALWLWGFLEHRRDWMDAPMNVFTIFTCHTVLKIWVMVEACHRFGEDRQSGALELLLATPIGVARLVEGQLLALRRQFAGPVLLMLTVDFLFLLSERTDRNWVLLVLAGMIVFVIDLVALAWVGMWFGLRARSGIRATWAAFWRLLAMPWAMFILLLIFAEIVTHVLNVGESGAIGVWFAISVLIGLFFGFESRHRLLAEFRTVATQRFQSGKPSRRQAGSAAHPTG
jgi:ABC-type transport system involved in cytochrome c biogenesis permease component